MLIMTERLDLPAYKLNVKDINSCYVVSDNETDHDQWIFPLAQEELLVENVWLQGFSSCVAYDKNSMFLTDEGEKVRIVGCKDIPGGSDWLSNHMYCMVVGFLQRIDDCAVVKALKITNLNSKCHLMKNLWKYEVEDAKLHLLQQISSEQ